MELKQRLKHRIFIEPDFRLERRDAQDGLPDIVGHAIVYNSIEDLGWFSEEVDKGACTECLKSAPDVASLFNHDPSLVLGRTPDSLELKEDERGLWTRTSPVDTTFARDLVKLIEARAVKQMSFGFYILDEEVVKKDGKPHFIIKRVELIDISPVTFPFYKGTEVNVERAKNHGVTTLEERLRAHGESETTIRDTVAEAEYYYREREISLIQSSTSL